MKGGHWTGKSNVSFVKSLKRNNSLNNTNNVCMSVFICCVKRQKSQNYDNYFIIFVLFGWKTCQRQQKSTYDKRRISVIKVYILR